jgi:hypothetical protein
MQIEIANPVKGGALRMSKPQADRYIRRGDAVMLESGRLLLTDPKTIQSHHNDSIVTDIRIVDGWIFPHTQWITAHEHVGADTSR